MKCATCNHWVALEEWDVVAGGLRRCKAVRQKWDVEDEVPETLRDGKYSDKGSTDPIDIAYGKAAEDVFKKALAVVNDGSQYRADLLTRPEFGCILHSAIATT